MPLWYASSSPPLRTHFTYYCLGKCGFINISLIKDSRHIRPLAPDAIFTPNVRIKRQDDGFDFAGKAHGLADNLHTYHSSNAADESAELSGIGWDDSSDSSDFVDTTIDDTVNTPDSSDTSTGNDGFEAADDDTSDAPDGDDSDFANDSLDTVDDSFDTDDGPVDKTSASAIDNGLPDSFDVADDSREPSDDSADASGGADLIDDDVDALDDVDGADDGDNLDPDDGVGNGSNVVDDGTSFIGDSGKNPIFYLDNYADGKTLGAPDGTDGVDAADGVTGGTDGTTGTDITDPDGTDGTDPAASSFIGDPTDDADGSSTTPAGPSSTPDADHIDDSDSSSTAPPAATPTPVAPENSPPPKASSSQSTLPQNSPLGSNTPTRCASSSGISSATVNFIKGSESLVPVPSPDPIGLLTVGYGHKCLKPKCSEVTFPFPLSPITASQLFAQDMMQYVNCLHRSINKSVVLNDNQFGALVSWTYNAGCEGMGSSTLVKRLNNGEDPDTVAAQELPKWNIAKKKVSKGLVNRRNREIGFFQTPSNVVAHPLC
jgi:GH24 family phage-related lysozyme (muramidase)/cell division septation protein DedD